MSEAPGDARDYFDKARTWAATGLFVAGALAVVGSVLDWVSIVDFPDILPPEEVDKAVPFNGLDVRDGWYTLVAGGVVIVSAFLLVSKGRSTFAWIAFLASMAIGAIAIADYRGIEDLFFTEADRVGEPVPGIGLTLVAIAALLGVISSVAGVAATPHRD